MTAGAETLVARTPRLELHHAGANVDVGELIEVFNSNPQWVAATNDLAGQTSYDRTDAEMYLWQGVMAANSACVAIHNRPGGMLIGIMSWIAPHPHDGCPWLGSLVVNAIHQRRGLGREALMAVEKLLAAEGWRSIRACPFVVTPGARAFLAALGYTPVKERIDQDKRRCMVMQKTLTCSGSPAL